MEFFILLGETPKDILGKWATVSGYAPVPPYFSLGYH
jgi:alpha 1,3-glucosidase